MIINKMKNKWEITRYLIDAKKNVDSIWFISENVEQLRFIDIRKRINEIRRDFYINCCIVLDESFAQTNKKKSEICSNDDIVKRVYYERDKNVAHKDENYVRKEYQSIDDIRLEMRKQLEHIRCVCRKNLPDVITLDFVAYDRELFRFIHHITADVEEDILKRKYPMRENLISKENAHSFTIFQDTEDLKGIPKERLKEYGVVIKDGICFFEGIQERQDACIRLNVLCGYDIWCSVNMKEMDKMIQLTQLGCFDEYGIIQEPPKDPILLSRINSILSSPIEE